MGRRISAYSFEGDFDRWDAEAVARLQVQIATAASEFLDAVGIGENCISVLVTKVTDSGIIAGLTYRPPPPTLSVVE